MLITIHQPEHMPWVGFFHKIAQADTFVVLDNVQFRKNYFQNRNKIRTPQGWQWITVPVSRSIDTLIKDVGIAKDARWKKKWLDAIYFSYQKSKYFTSYYQGISEVAKREWSGICDFNLALLNLLFDFLNIKTKCIRASELNVKGSGGELILNICKALQATTYLSGISGKEYLKIDDFTEENIKVILQEFHHPIYTQLYGPFIPCMSVVDLLFNYGKKSLDIIKGIDIPVMEKIFL